MRSTPNYQQPSKSVFIQFTLGLFTFLLLGLSGPAFSAAVKSDVVVFQEAESTFDDNDALGAYGDENDEYVSDEILIEDEPSQARTVTIPGSDQAEREQVVGYGDTLQEDDA